jgi:hypothetical protein
MTLTNEPLGGYPSISLNNFPEYHSDALHLNTGRNCLEYILRANKYKKIYLPYFVCETIFEPINKLDIKFEYYHIDKNLDPIITSAINDDEVILYVNYFGIKRRTVEHLTFRFQNLIADYTHDFFSKPLINTDTFYSARKFFGVPDGAYLYSKYKLKDNFEQDYSYNRMDHLLVQIDKGMEEGYELFCKNERILSRQPIRNMSHLTKALLRNINYEEEKKQRKDNLLLLHEMLGMTNELLFEPDYLEAPFVYPFLCTSGKGIKRKAIDNKIYIETYWDNVLNKVGRESFEARLINDLLPLPVNPKYSYEEIKFIGNYIMGSQV